VTTEPRTSDVNAVCPLPARAALPESEGMRRFMAYVPTPARDAMRAELTFHAIDGWTEHRTTGAWKEELEPITVFEILRPTRNLDDARAFARELGKMVRYVTNAADMPQDAVLITFEPFATQVVWS
jgi:hypothetical protein